MKDYSNIIEKLEDKNNELLSQVSSLNGQCSLLREQSKASELKLNELSTKKLRFTKAIELLSFLSELTKQETKEGFNSLITFALRYIFNEPYQFQLEFGKRGNYDEADFKILPPNRTECGDILDSNGGGVIDIVTLALRIVLLELSKPKNEFFLVLDEPCKHLSLQYRPKMGEFFRYISQKTNRQLIIITHIEELKEYADKAIKIGD
jgi:DNA repair ATPase RecN